MEKENIIKILENRLSEQDCTIRILKYQNQKLERLLAEEKAKNNKLEAFFSLQETED